MGGYASRLASVSNIAVNSVYRGRKRKCIEEDYLDEESEFIDRTLQTPKKRKLLTTAQYIYKTLFQEEKGSDVIVFMLGRAWRLHKVYISQSPYFASMFSGSWREANEKVIRIEIADPNITADSLQTVLGSFYQDEISLEPRDVISILATATLFQLQGLIDQCTEIMVETTNVKTVVPYYNAAVSYGVPAVKTAAKRWLEVNLLGYGWLHPTFLNEITAELMTDLISSPGLVAMQTEFCVYMMLRVWLFVQIHNKEETLQIDEYFKSHVWKEPFLATEEGKKYAAPFKALRNKYLILHDQDVKILYSDNLIPPDWLHSSYKEQWLHLLRIDANKDRGPKQMSDEQFSRECFRCGRCVERPGEHVWRWTAFHFGLDLVVYLDTTTLRIKRNHRLDTDHIKANHTLHNILLQVSVGTLVNQALSQDRTQTATTSLRRRARGKVGRRSQGRSGAPPSASGLLQEAHSMLCVRAEEMHDIIVQHFSSEMNAGSRTCTHVHPHSPVCLGQEASSHFFCLCGRYMHVTHREVSYRCCFVLRDPTVPKIEAVWVADLQNGDFGDSESEAPGTTDS